MPTPSLEGVNVSVPADQPNSVPCKLAFIGEAPGEEEVIVGTPLVGPSGRVFNAALSVAGVDRAACYVGNVWDFPVSSEGEKKTLMKQPVPQRLFDELDRVKPTVIVPMGAPALWAVSGMKTILHCRGTYMKVQGQRIMSTVHPAHVMRNWRWFSAFASDIAKARRWAEDPAFWPHEVNVRVCKDISMLDRAEDELLHNQTLISCDIETTRGQISSVSFAQGDRSAWVIPFIDEAVVHGRHSWASVEMEAHALGVVQRILASGIPLLFQNGIYDVSWFTRYGLAVRNWRLDTRVLQHAYSPELPRDLAFMGAFHCHVEPWKIARIESEKEEWE